MSTIASLLWPANAQVLVELARAGWTRFVWTKAPSPEMLDALAAFRARGSDLAVPADRVALASAEAERRADALDPLIARTMMPLGVPRGRGATVHAVARDAYRTHLETALLLIDALEAAHDDDPIVVLLLNETETKYGRVAARWARSRGVPVFMVTHGANLNRYYTCSAGLEADRAFVYGERGLDAFLDQGVPRAHLAVTGNPGWDQLGALRAEKPLARKRVVASSGFAPELPIVVFATTWSAKLSAFGDPPLHERVTRAFFTACAMLEASGARFNVLVKARPLDPMQQPELARLAAEVGLGGFAFTAEPMEGPLGAADLLVGFDTSAFVSAMLLDVPCINIWDETSWVFGPAFAGHDGIALVPIEDTARLAAAIREVLFDAGVRERLIELGAVRVTALSLPGEGAAARMAAQIAAALPPPESPWAALEGFGQVARLRQRAAHPALIGAIPPNARSVVVFDASDGTVAATAEHCGGATVQAAPDDALANRAWWERAGLRDVDAVVFPGTLHRVAQTCDVLALIRSTAPHATVVASVDNVRNLWLARDLIKGTLRYDRSGPLALDHLRWFTIGEALGLFRAAGYTVRAVAGIPDARRATLGPQPAEGVFDLTLPELVVRGLTPAVLDELTAEAWVITATP